MSDPADSSLCSADMADDESPQRPEPQSSDWTEDPQQPSEEPQSSDWTEDPQQPSEEIQSSECAEEQKPPTEDAKSDDGEEEQPMEQGDQPSSYYPDTPPEEPQTDPPIPLPQPPIEQSGDHGGTTTDDPGTEPVQDPLLGRQRNPYKRRFWRRANKKRRKQPAREDLPGPSGRGRKTPERETTPESQRTPESLQTLTTPGSHGTPESQRTPESLQTMETRESEETMESRETPERDTTETSRSLEEAYRRLPEVRRSPAPRTYQQQEFYAVPGPSHASIEITVMRARVASITMATPFREIVQIISSPVASFIEDPSVLEEIVDKLQLMIMCHGRRLLTSQGFLDCLRQLARNPNLTGNNRVAIMTAIENASSYLSASNLESTARGIPTYSTSRRSPTLPMGGSHTRRSPCPYEFTQEEINTALPKSLLDFPDEPSSQRRDPSPPLPTSFGGPYPSTSRAHQQQQQQQHQQQPERTVVAVPIRADLLMPQLTTAPRRVVIIDPQSAQRLLREVQNAAYISRVPLWVPTASTSSAPPPDQSGTSRREHQPAYQQDGARQRHSGEQQRSGHGQQRSSQSQQRFSPTLQKCGFDHQRYGHDQPTSGHDQTRYGQEQQKRRHDQQRQGHGHDQQRYRAEQQRSRVNQQAYYLDHNYWMPQQQRRQQQQAEQQQLLLQQQQQLLLQQAQQQQLLQQQQQLLQQRVLQQQLLQQQQKQQQQQQQQKNNPNVTADPNQPSTSQIPPYMRAPYYRNERTDTRDWSPSSLEPAEDYPFPEDRQEPASFLRPRPVTWPPKSTEPGQFWPNSCDGCAIHGDECPIHQNQRAPPVPFMSEEETLNYYHIPSGIPYLDLGAFQPPPGWAGPWPPSNRQYTLDPTTPPFVTEDSEEDPQQYHPRPPAPPDEDEHTSSQ